MESKNNLKWLFLGHDRWLPDLEHYVSSFFSNERPLWNTHWRWASTNPSNNAWQWSNWRATRCSEYRRALNNIEKRKNTLLSYLAMVLDTTSLMLIRHDCLDNKGLGDGHKAWGLLQERFRSNKTVKVTSVKRQLARLTLKENEALPQYVIRIQELSTRLGQAGGTLVRATTQRDGSQRPVRTLWAFRGAGKFQSCWQFCGAEEKTRQLRKCKYNSVPNSNSG